MRACDRPIDRRVFAAPSAEIARGSERHDFHVVDSRCDVARPIIVVVQRFRANFERKRDFGEFALFREIGGKVVAYKAAVEPNTFGFGAYGRKENFGIVEIGDLAFRARHAARRF